MKLVKIYFEAFKSLVGKELDIKHECIGFVGTNESGKSNVLAAINVLGGNRSLINLDTPKMAKDKSPSLRYVFALTDGEKDKYRSLIAKWYSENSCVSNALTYDYDYIWYEVFFDKEENQEKQNFIIPGLELNEDFYILDHNKRNDTYTILLEDKQSIPLSKAVLNHIKIIQNQESFINIKSSLEKLEEEILFHQSVISSEQERDAENSELTEKEKEKQKAELAKKNVELVSLLQKKGKIENHLQHFNITNIISVAENNISLLKNEITQLELDITEQENKLIELHKLPEPDETQKIEIETIVQNLSTFQSNKSNQQSILDKKQQELVKLNEPLLSKYILDSNELYYYIDDLLEEFFRPILPRVVFWEHSQKYILQSETLFADLLTKVDFDEISRPLVNIFRIGFGIHTIAELKTKIIEIQNSPNERSRLGRTLNIKINEFIKGVWQDYDQEINITLEKEQIRIEIFDPVGYEASYYNMEERSQGCQTFLSFLMTIGAEAEHGVIKNTILLLDEPETHLHPSGVRFMLQELIKISKRDNLVMYATHSIFLIDRLNFDRHIILEKKNEHTIIKPANKGRIGYFMQEEVLYNTLDLNLGKDLTSTNKFNFVFEGDGDAVLFEHFYDKILTKDTRPFPIEGTSFYQGGKCSDIQKYLTQRPIQLGTKWIFILDKDKPADDLKKFIESKYKNYVSTDIFVFQYANENKKGKEFEFEDLQSSQFIQEIYLKTCKKLNITIDATELAKLIIDEEPYSKYNDHVIRKFISNDFKTEFKVSFKEILNENIKERVEQIKDEANFKLSFPEFYKWTSLTMDKLFIKN